MNRNNGLVPLEQLVVECETWDPRRPGHSMLFTYIDIGSIDQRTKQIVASEISTVDAPSRARQLVKAGDVLVSTVRPNLNAVARVPEQLDGATASTGFAVLRPIPTKIDSSYLYHWVRTPMFVREMMARSTGANYPAVSATIIKNSKIPLPTLSEQRRITVILDKADAIRRRRQEATRVWGDFLRSAFLDLFGEPSSNSKKWDERRLGEISDIQSGVTKGRDLKGKASVSVPYMRVANVQDGRILLDDVKQIEVLPSDVERLRLAPGDVLLTEGGDPDKLGRGAVWRGEIDPCIHQNHIFRVRPHLKTVLPDYLSMLIGSTRGKTYFLRAAKQTTGIATINRTQLDAFTVPLPPLNLQEKFAKLVGVKASIDSRVTELEGSGEKLFSALARQAFHVGL